MSLHGIQSTTDINTYFLSKIKPNDVKLRVTYAMTAYIAELDKAIA